MTELLVKLLPKPPPKADRWRRIDGRFSSLNCRNPVGRRNTERFNPSHLFRGGRFVPDGWLHLTKIEIRTASHLQSAAGRDRDFNFHIVFPFQAELRRFCCRIGTRLQCLRETINSNILSKSTGTNRHFLIKLYCDFQFSSVYSHRETSQAQTFWSGSRNSQRA